MLILHISDIHFQAPECLDPWTDPHAPIRTRMMRDLAERRKTLGDVDAILVGGDIAFKAAPEEYDAARNWLQQLSQLSGCPKERIFVVPGNHDVDRKMIKDDISIQNVQHAIASSQPGQLDGRLRRQLADKTAGQNLLKPHGAYNAFAAPFGCQIWPEKPFWHQDIPLGGGVTLRLYGLTSTLLSGQQGGNDVEKNLFLTAMQTVLDPAPNTANLVIVHHPLDWLGDADTVDDALSNRAMFHLFGHKHRQRALLADTFVRLGAGAVNPSLGEKPYEPGYNLIKLDVTGAGAARKIDIELHQRTLQAAPELFVSIKAANGADVFRKSIPIPEEVVIVPAEPDPPAPKAIAAPEPGSPAAVPESALQEAEAAIGEVDTRDLLYRFWSLASSERREIALGLNLLGADEMRLPEPERYGKAFIRAGALGLIEKLAAEVAGRES